MEKSVETHRSGRVAMIVIDRPKALNAVNGAKAFIADADISQFATATPAVAEQLALATKRMHGALRDCTKPVIAAVNGFLSWGRL